MPDEDPLAGASFAQRLNYLFATRLSARGRPYTLQEVCAGTGGKLTKSYLSLLRKGTIAVPSGEKVQALADFFGVETGFFYGKATAPEHAASLLNAPLRQALATPGVLQGAIKLSDLSPEQRAMILDLIDRAHKIVTDLKAQENDT